jgi:hypothetical protein
MAQLVCMPFQENNCLSLHKNPAASTFIHVRGALYNNRDMEGKKIDNEPRHPTSFKTKTLLVVDYFYLPSHLHLWSFEPLSPSLLSPTNTKKGGTTKANTPPSLPPFLFPPPFFYITCRGSPKQQTRLLRR